MTRLHDQLTTVPSETRLIVRLGRALLPGEVRVRLSLLRMDQPEVSVTFPGFHSVRTPFHFPVFPFPEIPFLIIPFRRYSIPRDSIPSYRHSPVLQVSDGVNSDEGNECERLQGTAGQRGL